MSEQPTHLTVDEATDRLMALFARISEQQASERRDHEDPETTEGPLPPP